MSTSFPPHLARLLLYPFATIVVAGLSACETGPANAHFGGPGINRVEEHETLAFDHRRLMRERYDEMNDTDRTLYDVTQGLGFNF